MATCVHAVVCTNGPVAVSGSKVFLSTCEPRRLCLPSHAHFTTWSPHRCRHAPSCSGRLSRHSAPKISVIATIDQGSHPLTPRVPTANQIFDAQHVPQVSPSLLLYFPLGAYPRCAQRHISSDLKRSSQSLLTRRSMPCKHPHGALGHPAGCRYAMAYRQQSHHHW